MIIRTGYVDGPRRSIRCGCCLRDADLRATVYDLTPIGHVTGGKYEAKDNIKSGGVQVMRCLECGALNECDAKMLEDFNVDSNG